MTLKMKQNCYQNVCKCSAIIKQSVQSKHILLNQYIVNKIWFHDICLTIFQCVYFFINFWQIFFIITIIYAHKK